MLGGSSWNDVNCAISASVFTWKDPVRLMTTLVTHETPKTPVLRPYFYGLYKRVGYGIHCTRTVDWSDSLDRIIICLFYTH